MLGIRQTCSAKRSKAAIEILDVAIKKRVSALVAPTKKLKY
jgi:hypothetical protein